jgi:hypothetical protein
VQRAVIALAENAVLFERVDVDLANKPRLVSDNLSASRFYRATASVVVALLARAAAYHTPQD